MKYLTILITLIALNSNAGWFSNEFELGEHNGQQAFIMNGLNVDKSTPESLLDMVKAHPTVKTVVIGNSLGGQTWSGIKAGFIINKFGLDTVVTGGCESACTYIWLGGAERSIEGDAYLGYHQPKNGNSSKTNSEREEYNRSSLSMVEGYMDQMNAPQNHKDAMAEGTSAYYTIHVNK